MNIYIYVVLFSLYTAARLACHRVPDLLGHGAHLSKLSVPRAALPGLGSAAADPHAGGMAPHQRA